MHWQHGLHVRAGSLSNVPPPLPARCPDGVFRGHLRTNAAGANLNREVSGWPLQQLLSGRAVCAGLQLWPAPHGACSVQGVHSACCARCLLCTATLCNP